MKKILAVLLVMLMAFSLFGCNQQGGPEQNDIGAGGNDGTQNIGDDDSATVPPRMEIEEVVVLDNEFCIIKITAIDPGNLSGYSLETYMENKTADKNLIFSVDSASINGVQTDPFFSAEIVAGKKSNELISFSNTALEKNDIGDYTDIFLSFTVSDADDWSAEAVASTSVHVYPQGQDKAGKYSRPARETDKVLVDNEQFTILATGFTQDEIWGYTMDLYVVNKTDETVMINIDDASINDYMADAFYAVSVDGGNCAFGSVSWSAFVLEKNKITKVNEIEFLLQIKDKGDWMTEDLLSKVITVNP